MGRGERGREGRGRTRDPLCSPKFHYNNACQTLSYFAFLGIQKKILKYAP